MIGRIISLPLRAAWFTLWFAGQLLTSSVSVIGDILSPGLAATPRVVRLPLGSAGDAHVTAISVLITLTPGTLVLGVVESERSGRTLLVHTLYHSDSGAALAALSDMDRRMTRAVRLRGDA